jgi:hypothetical protein
MNCQAIGYMRRIDGALPPAKSGLKSLDFFAGKGKSRFFVRESQPYYGWWFYYAMEEVICPLISRVISDKFFPKTAARVDQLMDFKFEV